MEKLVYILEHKEDLDRKDFARQLLDEIVPKMLEAGARDITLHIADLDEAMVTPETTTPRIFGEWNKVSAAVHFWLSSLDHRDPYENLLHEVASGFDGYLVTESLVQPYERLWANGKRRPGVTQFSLGKKPSHASEEHFYHHWQEIHSPFSFALHPGRWSYVRNAVARPLTRGAPPWRFIVLEHWKELRGFTDERLYYGSPEILEQCWKDVPEFLEMNSYVSGPMSEYGFW